MRTREYRVNCARCGVVSLTEHEYEMQLDYPDQKWMCPQCGELCNWEGEFLPCDQCGAMIDAEALECPVCGCYTEMSYDDFDAIIP